MATSTTAFPDSTTTGVPPGTTLTPYNGDLTINTPGAVVSGLDIHGTVYINAPNVTLLNCQVTNANYFTIKIADVAGVTVQNCTINGVGTNNDGSDGIDGVGNFINNNIFNVENGIAVDGTGPTLIQGNYIHDMLASGSPHYDGIQIDGGISNVTIEHNTIVNSHDQTSAVMIDNDFGPISNIKVDNNLLVGGGYTIYVDAQFNSSPITNVSITNNHMGTGSWGITAFNQSSPVYTGNTNDGAAVLASLNKSGEAAGPASPIIEAFSPDSGIVGDHITNANQLTLSGTAQSASTVAVFDGATQIGTAAADANGQWTLATKTLSDGLHNLTATDTTASGTSAASADFAVTIDTHVPNAPTLAAYSQGGAAVGSSTTSNDILLKGAAEANSTINVFDTGKLVGTATAGGDGTWSLDTGQLANGAHSFTASATDVAGTTSAASPPLNETISPDQGTHRLLFKGSAPGGSSLQVFDGNTPIGTTQVDSTGHWTFATPSVVSNTLHTFKVAEIGGSPSAASTFVFDPSGGNTLTSVQGNEYFFGSGHPDTFVFAPNFGHSILKNFATDGAAHDTIQFSASEFDSFASVLSHASQVGQDVVIAAGNDMLTLKNTQVGALQDHDFHFV